MAEKNLVKFQTYYERYHTDVGTEFDPMDSLTDQDYKMTTDINYLLEHMAGHSRTPLYGVQETMTFEDWSNEMAKVKRRFLHLSLEEQQKFGNAQNFLKWCSDSNNYADILPTVVHAKEEERKRIEFEQKQKLLKAE